MCYTGLEKDLYSSLPLGKQLKPGDTSYLS